MYAGWGDPKDLNHTLLSSMTHSEFVNDQRDLALSIDDFSDVNGGGVVGAAGYFLINLLTFAVPGMIDAANGFPWLTESMNFKYSI